MVQTLSSQHRPMLVPTGVRTTEEPQRNHCDQNKSELERLMSPEERHRCRCSELKVPEMVNVVRLQR